LLKVDLAEEETVAILEQMQLTAAQIQVAEQVALDKLVQVVQVGQELLL
jgi:ribosome-interacting GTPase 1